MKAMRGPHSSKPKRPRANQMVRFRWGQLITGLEGARALVELARRTGDLLSVDDRKRLSDAGELLASVEQRAWEAALEPSPVRSRVAAPLVSVVIAPVQQSTRRAPARSR